VSGVTFSVSSGPAPRVVTLDDPQVVVAGFTGRDRASVEAHISELVGLGVPRPDTVPAFFVNGKPMSNYSYANLRAAIVAALK